jgi:hypothetical protein
MNSDWSKKSMFLYEKCKKAADDEIDLLYSSPDTIKPAGSFKVLQSSHKRSNFICGNTRLQSFQEVITRVLTLHMELLQSSEFPCTLVKTEWNFIDLGCGNGECLAAVLLLNHFMLQQEYESTVLPRSNDTNLFTQLIGVDLQRQQLECAEYLIKHVKQCMTIGIETGEGEAEVIDHSVCHPFPKVDLLCDDFLSVNWSYLLNSADNNQAVSCVSGKKQVICYLCATCFTDEMILEIMRKVFPMFVEDGIGAAYIVCLDKDLLEYYEKDVSSFSYSLHSLFYVNCFTSWGNGVAYVYRLQFH